MSQCYSRSLGCQRLVSLGSRAVPPRITARPFVSSTVDGSSLNVGRRTVVVYNGVFGVGAPEALLVGVVALIVFGPQGLVEAAKAAASAIRSVQPAIQEFNQASSDIRTSINNEIGLDAIQKEFRDIEQTTRDSLRLDTPSFAPRVPDPSPSTTQPALDSDKGASEQAGDSAATNGATGVEPGLSDSEKSSLSAIAQELNASEDNADGQDKGKSSSGDGGTGGEEDIEKMRADSAAMAWAASTANQTGGMNEDEEGGYNPSAKKRLEDMTMAELEGELARRKELIARINNLN